MVGEDSPSQMSRQVDRAHVSRAVRRLFHSGQSTVALVWEALKMEEAGLWDLYLLNRGNRFSLEHLWPELRTLITATVR